MKLFNKSKKQKDPIDTRGWDAITAAAESIYPEQKEPLHYATIIKWRLGGSEPLDGISVYDGGDFWHFVTYGLSELYEKETDNPEESGYGMEFTFKLKKTPLDDEESEIKCVCGILQTIARMTFERDEIFDEWEWLYSGQTVGIDVERKSAITGFITIPDPQIKPIFTPNGKVRFVEFVGATDAELRAVKEKRISVKELYEKLGSDVTDYARASVV